ncbi:unnamed protein product [Lepidochelys olivacea]
MCLNMAFPESYQIGSQSLPYITTEQRSLITKLSKCLDLHLEKDLIMRLSVTKQEA